jgi:peptidoglycan/LPS O-acetylase OafA/YrhL
MPRLQVIHELWRGAWDHLRHRAPDNVPGLDFLRSCAILLVFTGHASEAFGAPHWFSRLPISNYGWTGVDLFFVLSGLLIGTQLWKELKRTGDIRIGRFLMRRGFRIWPLYSAFVLLAAAEVLLLGHSGSGLWADATYLSNYFHNQIGGSWSLSTEEQFYILAPLTLALCIRFLRLERMWLIPAVAPLILIGSRFWTMSQHSSLTVQQLDQVLYFPIHTHADGLAIGLLLAWLVVMRPNWIGSAKFRRFAAAGALLAGGALYVVKPILTNFTALGLIYAALVLLSLGGARTPRIVNWHGFYIVSRLSYGIYLNHLGLMAMGKPFKADGSPTFFLYYAVTLLLSIAVAALTFTLIEWPFLWLRDRWSGRARTMKATSATA